MISLFPAVIIEAQPVNFVSGTWQEVKTKARSENKYLFVDCYTEWCGWCKVLDEKTFSNVKVGDFMNRGFISVKIDMEKGYGINLAMKYRVNAFPTGLIFNPEGKLVYVTIGFQAPEAFLNTLKEALNPDNQYNLKGISDIIDMDYPQFYKDAFGAGGKRKYPDQAAINKFLSGQEDLFSEISWSVISRFTVGEKYLRFFLDNLGKYRDLYGYEADKKINDILGQNLNTAIKEKNENLFRESLMQIDKYIEEPGKQEMLQSFKLDYFSNTDDWKSFAQEFKFYIDSKGYSDPGLINSYCWRIYETCANKEIIAKACEWMKNASGKDPQYAYIDTYAALLFKAGRYKEAEDKASEAIVAGKKAGEDVKSTVDLIGKIQAAAK